MRSSYTLGGLGDVADPVAQRRACPPGRPSTVDRARRRPPARRRSSASAWTCRSRDGPEQPGDLPGRDGEVEVVAAPTSPPRHDAERLRISDRVIHHVMNYARGAAPASRARVGQVAVEVALEGRARTPRPASSARHRGERLERRARSGSSTSPTSWLATSGIRRSGSVEPERRPDRAEHHPQEPSRSSVLAGGLDRLPRTRRERAAAACSRVVPDREEHPQQPLPRAVRPGRRRPARAPRAGRPAAPARRRTGRPWCRSSGAPAPASTPASAATRADRRAGEALVGERRPAPPSRISPGCRARPAGGRARRSRRHAGSRHGARGATGEVSAGERQRLRAGRPRAPRGRAALRVLISSTMWPAKPVAGQVLEEARRRPGCRGPGTRCSSLAEPVPSVRWTWRSRSPSRSAIATGSDCGDRGVREVDGGVGVGLAPTGPSRAGTSRIAAARGGPPGVHVLDRERDAGATPRAPAMPVDEARGVVALPAERRVHDDHVGADGVRHLGRALELAPRVGAPDPLGDQQARRVHRADGSSWWSRELLDRRRSAG